MNRPRGGALEAVGTVWIVLDREITGNFHTSVRKPTFALFVSVSEIVQPGQQQQYLLLDALWSHATFDCGLHYLSKVRQLLEAGGQQAIPKSVDHGLWNCAGGIDDGGDGFCSEKRVTDCFDKCTYLHYLDVGSASGTPLTTFHVSVRDSSVPRNFANRKTSDEGSPSNVCDHLDGDWGIENVAVFCDGQYKTLTALAESEVFKGSTEMSFPSWDKVEQFLSEETCKT